MSRPGADSVGTESPYILPYIVGKLRTPLTFKVLEPYIQTQPALSERAVKPTGV